ncbi:MAG: hypothetical protein WBD75_08950 [Phycisphaerae bacterium]
MGVAVEVLGDDVARFAPLQEHHDQPVGPVGKSVGAFGEEAYRFVKQAYRLEDVRVHSYVALRNVYALVTAVLYFVSVVIGAKAKLSLIFKRVCEKAKRFYEIATFYQYAVADGIHRLLFGSRGGPAPPPPPSDTGQLILAFAKPPA